MALLAEANKVAFYDSPNRPPCVFLIVAHSGKHCRQASQSVGKRFDDVGW